MNRSELLPVYTVGHSVRTEDQFLGLLRHHDIDLVLDVRSSPYSRRVPHFNRANIKSWLDRAGVGYSFGGRTLGGRPEDPTLYVGGQVSYVRMAATEAFVASLRRVALAARTHRVALMCAEADPIECHRFLMIGRALHERSLDVQHVLPSGMTESHAQAEQRMLAAVGLLQSDIFGDRGDVLSEAYAVQASRCAFVISDSPLPPNFSSKST